MQGSIVQSPSISTGIPMQTFICVLVSTFLSTGVLAKAPPDVGAIVAAEIAASGGAKILTRARSMKTSGRLEIRDAPGRFDATTNFVTGEYDLALRTGPRSDRNGVDAIGPWLAQDGIVMAIDLPAAVQDANAQSWLMRYGWRRGDVLRWLKAASLGGAEFDIIKGRPAGASPVTLWFNRRTHHLTRSSIQGDGGPLIAEYADWRRFGDVVAPFRERRLDPTGQEMLLLLENMALSSDEAKGVARPKSHARGSLRGASSTTTPFVFSGIGRGHIIVDAKVNGIATKLTFDTGAANYIVPQAAIAFGLKIEGGISIGGVGENSTTGFECGKADVRLIADRTAADDPKSAIKAGGAPARLQTFTKRGIVLP